MSQWAGAAVWDRRSGQREPLGLLIVRGLALAYEPQPVPALPAAGAGAMFAGGARGVHTRVASAAWLGATDVLSLLAIVFSIPLVVLGVGVPIALAVQLLLWIGRPL